MGALPARHHLDDCTPHHRLQARWPDTALPAVALAEVGCARDLADGPLLRGERPAVEPRPVDQRVSMLAFPVTGWRITLRIDADIVQAGPAPGGPAGSGSKSGTLAGR